MPAHRIISRNYICRFCGKLRRAPAAYLPGAPPAPRCCGHAMELLDYEQTVAATQFSETERIEWMAAGGQVVERGGKRRWRAIW